MRGCVFVWDYDTPVPIGQFEVSVEPKGPDGALLREFSDHSETHRP